MTLPLSIRRIAAAVDALGFTTHEVSPTRLIAYRKDLRAGFDAHWKASDKGTTTFESALIRDPVGQPRELFYEYKAPAIHRGKYETDKSFQNRVSIADADAARQNATYNDGATIMEHEWLVTSTTGVHLWLNDWMEILGVECPRLPIPKPRLTKAEQNEAALAAGTEWSAE